GDGLPHDEAPLPVHVQGVLCDSFPDHLYPNAVWVGVNEQPSPAPGPRDAVNVQPERGVFSFVGAPPTGQIVTPYRFGFMSMIGAGGFPERSVTPIPPPPSPPPAHPA